MYYYHCLTWSLRIALGVLLVCTVYAADDIARLPLSTAWKLPLRIFWWQEVLFLCALIVGLRILIFPNDLETNDPISAQYMSLAVSLGLARQLDWFYYFVSAATCTYYCHLKVPDNLIIAWVIFAIFLLLFTQGNLWDELSILFAIFQAYVSLLAGNFWGILMGCSMVFNYSRRLQLDMNGMLDIPTTRIIISGYLITIICTGYFFPLMQDQSAIHIVNFSPLQIRPMQFHLMANQKQL